MVDILSGFALFADLTTPELESIVQTFDEVYFSEGERVIRQGLTATGFDGFLRKPFQLRAAIEMVNHVLNAVSTSRRSVPELP